MTSRNESTSPTIAHSPLPKSTRFLLAVLVLLGVVAGVAYAYRRIGFLRFERAIAGLEVPRSDGRSAPVGPEQNAALPLAELEQLVEGGRAELLSDPDARQALEQILLEPEPAPEAWTLVESGLTRLDEAFLVIDRICARPSWRFDGADGSLLARVKGSIRLRLLDQVVPWVSAAAVHAARAGDHALALRRLRQAFHLSAATKDEPSSNALVDFVQRSSSAFGALAQVLRVLPLDQDLAWLAEELGSTDPSAMLSRASAGDFHASLELYRRGSLKELIVSSLSATLLAGGSGYTAGLEPDLSLLGRQARVYPLIAGHDAAHFVELCADVFGWLDGSLADASRLVEDLEARWGKTPWYAPTAPFVASLLTRGVLPCIDLESRLRLARIALADREQGRERALKAMDETLDPANDQPIGYRSEDDGAVLLWCIGSDLIDMGGSPDQGDIVWILPARR
jgi:hypothetical protein